MVSLFCETHEGKKFKRFEMENVSIIDKEHIEYMLNSPDFSFLK